MDISLDARVQQIKERVATAQRMQARAAHDYDTANAALTDTVQRLSTEFGVTSVVAAQTLLAELEGQLVAELLQINTELDRVQVDTAPPTA
jgi:capsule polysaccharide export protein KpsE/RkpR